MRIHGEALGSPGICAPLHSRGDTSSTTGSVSNGLQPVVRERIVVDEEGRAANEEGPGTGDVEVIERLDRVGLDAIDPDDAAEGCEG